MEQQITLSQFAPSGGGSRFEVKPNAVPFGDYVAPLLYIWYCGSRNARAQDLAKIEDMFKSFLEWNAGDTGSDATTALNEAKLLAPKWKTLLIGAVKKNTSFLRALESAANSAYARFSARLPKTGKYYKQENGKYSNVPSSTAFATEQEKLAVICEVYYTLMLSGLIDYTAETGVAPINIYTGEFYVREHYPQTDGVARFIQVPSTGIFTVNRRPRGAYYQRTFTGVDAQCLASTGNVVSALDGLTSISWSIHRGKSTPRNLGRPAPSVRARGSRTVAGTMIFTVADHHPLLNLIPADQSAFRKLELVNNQKQWRPIVLADQLPPFDLTVVLTNEYGNSAILIIYGVEIVDEGSVLSTDNLLTEVTLQYVAVGMDPIQEIMGGEVDGTIIVDPYGITKGGGEEFFRRREVVMDGFAYTDYESAYDAYYRSIIETYRKRG